MASQGLPGKCSKHAVYTPTCRYCRNLSGMAVIDTTGVALSSPATVQGQAPDMSEPWPSLAGLTPLYDRVVVVQLKAGEPVAGALVVPETVRDGYPFGVGRVVAVGPGRLAHTTGEIKGPLDTEVGDVVVYDKKAGFAIPWEGDTEALVLREPEILGRMPRGGDADA